MRDGDHIHAVIRGGALSNDGKGEFVLSPNSKGRRRFMAVVTCHNHYRVRTLEYILASHCSRDWAAEFVFTFKLTRIFNGE